MGNSPFEKGISLCLSELPRELTENKVNSPILKGIYVLIT